MKEKDIKPNEPTAKPAAKPKASRSNKPLNPVIGLERFLDSYGASLIVAVHADGSRSEPQLVNVSYKLKLTSRL